MFKRDKIAQIIISDFRFQNEFMNEDADQKVILYLTSLRVYMTMIRISMHTMYAMHNNSYNFVLEAIEILIVSVVL